jgi:hypothetical protein
MSIERREAEIDTRDKGYLEEVGPLHGQAVQYAGRVWQCIDDASVDTVELINADGDRVYKVNPALVSPVQLEHQPVSINDLRAAREERDS